ncbi:UDP-N-acetylmuramoyl-tripeptide--D-alanyl-D-alanine ligase [Gammaproteobacteria bacterium]|jgi:UDP-N-acetylmuramoyl-tripeptide--D-alanyl-D-alanine ligase|nr:UDP-N-acetylmuramoyl-tripeptide--D-alanyl-D-alanine ligase [Gammaproteobacteria bacterium]
MLSSAATVMLGTLHGSDAAFDGVSIDTRTLCPGELFFALEGPNFDGGDFVGEAAARGAAGAVVSSLVDENIAQVKVEDTRLALGALGSAWRQQQAVTVVAITGSNGKTTLKELTAACLQQSAPTLATAGNLNNEIGMPLMLLRLQPSHQYAVIEMGANHAGEIAYLTALAKPDVVVITNAAAAHLEGFGSIEGVAHAKGEILQGEKRPDCAVLNADDDYFAYWRSLVDDIDVLSFGFGAGADVRADEIFVDKGVTRFLLQIRNTVVPVSLQLPGIHNVRNACAAAAAATALGVSPDDIARALEAVQPISGRLQPLEGHNGATVYDDTYNANPLSVLAAGEFLASLPGEGFFVLGDMKELGQDELRMHTEVGKGLKDAGISRLFAMGELCRDAVDAFGPGAVWYASIEALTAGVLEHMTHEVNVLVKGSRSMRMERVVNALLASEKLRREA